MSLLESAQATIANVKLSEQQIAFLKEASDAVDAAKVGIETARAEVAEMTAKHTEAVEVLKTVEAQTEPADIDAALEYRARLRTAADRVALTEERRDSAKEAVTTLQRDYSGAQQKLAARENGVMRSVAENIMPARGSRLNDVNGAWAAWAIDRACAPHGQYGYETRFSEFVDNHFHHAQGDELKRVADGFRETIRQQAFAE